MNLFDVVTGFCGDGRNRMNPRNAKDMEVRAYLDWLAARDGVAVPAGAKYGPEGITHGGRLILAMPGYGDTRRAVLEVLDDDGNVIRSTPIAVKPNGQMTLTKAQVQEASGLKPIRASRKAKPAPIAAQVQPVAPKAGPAEPQEREGEPMRANAPEQAPEASTGAPAGAAPMFATVADFKRAAVIGSRWRKAMWRDGAWHYSPPECVRTVARIQSQDLAFAVGEVSREEAARIGQERRGNLTWLAFPKRGAWRSDAQGLVILYPDGTPNIRFDLVPADAVEALPAAPDAPAQAGEPVSHADELPTAATVKDSLTVQAGEPARNADRLPAGGDKIAEIEARLAALEAALAAQAVSAAQATPTAAVRAKRTPAHERAVRRAWAERRAARLRRDIAEDNRWMREALQEALSVEDSKRRRAVELALSLRASKREERRKRAASAQRARRMLSGQREAAAAVLAQVATLRDDRDRARTASAAIEARARAAEAERDGMLARVSAMIDRMGQAEAALRVLQAA